MSAIILFISPRKLIDEELNSQKDEATNMSPTYAFPRSEGFRTETGLLSHYS